MAHHWQSPGASASPATDLRIDQGATAVPTYQYACTNPEGKHEFEVVQSFSDAPVTECPECGAPVRKVYGSVGVVFKGSGFYRTDSRKSATASETLVLVERARPRRRRVVVLVRKSSSLVVASRSAAPSTSGSGGPRPPTDHAGRPAPRPVHRPTGPSTT